MSHTTEIVGKPKQVSDEAIAVTIRCCGDPKSDSTLTIYGIGKITADELNAQIDAHHDRVAAKHHGMGTGKSLLSGIIAKTKTHEAK